MGREGSTVPRLGPSCTAPAAGGKQRKGSTQNGLQHLFSVSYAWEISSTLNLVERGIGVVNSLASNQGGVCCLQLPLQPGPVMLWP